MVRIVSRDAAKDCDPLLPRPGLLPRFPGSARWESVVANFTW